MALEILESVAGLLGDLVNPETWPDEIEAWGTEIALNRDYIDGKQRLELNDDMKAILRIEDDPDPDRRFNVNYAKLVVNRMADRLNLERIDAIVDNSGINDPDIVAENNRAGNEWISDMLVGSDFDELQIDVSKDGVGDGDTFVMLSPLRILDNGTVIPSTFVHEPAWDNEVGLIPVYGAQGRMMVAAVKVWLQTDGNERINIYYVDRVEKFVNGDDGLSTFTDPESDDKEWVAEDGQPLGVPFGHFRNDKKTRSWNGTSRIQPMIPAQDVLNRTYMSIVAAGEATGFQRMASFGFTPTASVAPGSIWTIVEHEKNADGSQGDAIAGLSSDRFYDLKVIEPGELAPLISSAVFSIEQIGTITNTPLPTVEGGGADQSGEALKQRESGLLAEGNTNQIVFGNVWERLVMMAWRAEMVFNPTKPPAIKRANSVWTSIEVRNATEIIDNINKMQDDLPIEKRLEEAAPVFKSYDVAEIPGMVTRVQEDKLALTLALVRNGQNGRADRNAPSNDIPVAAEAVEATEGVVVA